MTDKPISQWTKEDFAEAARRGDTAPFLEWQRYRKEEEDFVASIEEGEEMRRGPCEACDTTGVIKDRVCSACGGLGWREP